MLQNEKHEKYISKNDAALITQGVIRAARRLPENPYNRGGDAPGVIGE
jgi:hypothetical protein